MRVFVEGATGAIGKQLVPRLVAARDAQGPVRKDSLAIAQMPDDFLDRPFAGCITEIPIALGARRKELRRLEPLRLELRQDIAALDLGDIRLVERRVFARLGPHKCKFRGAHSRPLYSRDDSAALRA